MFFISGFRSRPLRTLLHAGIGINTSPLILGTDDVDVYPFQLSTECTVFLIDTPGFNDGRHSDADILSKIAE